MLEPGGERNAGARAYTPRTRGGPGGAGPAQRRPGRRGPGAGNGPGGRPRRAPRSPVAGKARAPRPAAWGRGGGPAACWGSSARASRAALGRGPGPGVPGAKEGLTGKARIRILVSFRLPVPLLRFDMVLVPSPAAASGRTPRRRCHI